jgi:hypothetical protein
MSDTTNSGDPGTPETGKSPFSIWFWLAAALLVAVVVVGVIVAVSSANRPPSSEPTGSSTPAPPTSDSDSICGLAAGDQSIPTTAPPETEWELVGKVAAPTSPEVGPGDIDGTGLRTCFAHSPVGALFATANIYAQGADAALAVPSLEYFVLDGPGKAVAIATAREAGASGGGGIQVVGFKVVEYAEGEATIDVAFRNSSGGLASLPTVVRWDAGDWRLVVQDNGQAPIPPKQLTSLAGYIAWSGA